MTSHHNMSRSLARLNWCSMLKVACLSLIVLFTLSCGGHSEAELDFSDFYDRGLNIGWILAAVFAIGAAAAAWVSGGTAGPVVTAIGTWIGKSVGLYGAAATNYGLALLGGGSVASGGLGVVGGSALLAAALSFTGDIVIDSTVSATFEYFDRRRFVEATRESPVLPLPRNASGSKPFKRAVKSLESNYDADVPHYVDENQEVIRKAIAELKADVATSELSTAEVQRCETLMALLQTYLNDSEEAHRRATRAIALGSLYSAADAGNGLTRDPGAVVQDALSKHYKDDRIKQIAFPLTLWAISGLGTKDVDLDLSLKAVRKIIAVERESNLLPLVVAIFTERLLHRQDLIAPTQLEGIGEAVVDEVEAEDVRIPIVQTLLVRNIVMLKVKQDLLRNIEVSSSRGEDLVDQKGVVDSALKDFEAYKANAWTLVSHLEGNRGYVDDASNATLILSIRESLKSYDDEGDRLRDALGAKSGLEKLVNILLLVGLALGLVVAIRVARHRRRPDGFSS